MPSRFFEPGGWRKRASLSEVVWESESGGREGSCGEVAADERSMCGYYVLVQREDVFWLLQIFSSLVL